MSRKHYRAMAGHIHELNARLADCLPTPESVNAQSLVLEFARNVASDFKADSGEFDRNRFLQACGYAVDMGGNVTVKR